MLNLSTMSTSTGAAHPPPIPSKLACDVIKVMFLCSSNTFDNRDVAYFHAGLIKCGVLLNDCSFFYLLSPISSRFPVSPMYLFQYFELVVMYFLFSAD